MTRMNTDILAGRNGGFGYLEKHDSGKRPGRFSFRQLFGIGRVVGHQVLSLELVEGAALWAEKQRDGLLAFALRQAFTPEGGRRVGSHPDFGWFWIVFVTQAKGEDLLPAVKNGAWIAGSGRGVRVVGTGDLGERVVA